jgi:hypothetical protein
MLSWSWRSIKLLLLHLVGVPYLLYLLQYILSSKTRFIVPTDAHYYKIIETLKQFKIIILASTCFSSRKNHHQGAVLCLAKTTKWFFCARRYRRSQCYGGISACCAGVLFTARPHNRLIWHWLRLYRRAQKAIFVVLAKHRTSPWWSFLRELKHVGASIIILNCFNVSMIL